MHVRITLTPFTCAASNSAPMAAFCSFSLRRASLRLVCVSCGDGEGSMAEWAHELEQTSERKGEGR